MTARVVIVLLVLLAAVSGCGVHPMAGTSAAILNVTAEPKKGAVQNSTSNQFVSDYGTISPGQLNSAMEQVDYSNLGNIIVWDRALHRCRRWRWM
jgi:hypothetical protein